MKHYSTNTVTTQIDVKGWKNINNASQYQVYENETFYQLVIATSVQFSSTSWATVFTVPSPYRPKTNVTLLASSRQVKARMGTTGEVQVINMGTSEQNTGVNGVVYISK